MHLFLLQGFDEFMNLTMDDAEEVYVKENKRRQVGEYVHMAAHSLSPPTWEGEAACNVQHSANLYSWISDTIKRCMNMFDVFIFELSLYLLLSQVGFY